MASIASSLSYTELMDLVYSIPPLRPTHLAQGILGTVIALIVIDTIAVGLRIYVRTILNRSAFGLDDVLAAAGYVCYLVATVYAAVGCFYGFGTRDADLPSQLYQIRGAQLFMWWIISYIFSIPFIKSAIAAQIMRLTKLRSYRIPLWFVIGGSTANALAGLIAVLVHCRPISASWTGQGRCTSNLPLLILSYIFTAVAIIVDFTCAILPFFLIRKLNMNARRKWSLMVILSVGICACIFTVLRVPYIKHYMIPQDSLYYLGYLILYSMLEEGVGMFAASLPSLRKLFANFYRSSSNPGHTYSGQPQSMQYTGGASGASMTYPNPCVVRGQFSASVSAQRDHDEVQEDEDANSRHGIVIQRDVLVEGGPADSQKKRDAASSSLVFATVFAFAATSIARPPPDSNCTPRIHSQINGQTCGGTLLDSQDLGLFFKLSTVAAKIPPP